jgi:formylmethanofuran dehydrogenase subunit E
MSGGVLEVMGAGVRSQRVAICCNKCGAEDTVTWYQANVSYQKWCKACRGEVYRKHRAKRKAAGRPIPRSAERVAEYEQERSARPEVKARRAADMSRYQADPVLRIRHQARWQVRQAIAAGRIARQPCEQCGELNVHGHHDDYTKPLDVRWLCPPCHRQWHRHNTPIYSRTNGSDGRKG